MGGIFGRLFGTDTIVKKGMELLDDAFYTDAEKAEDKKEATKEKTRAKVELLTAYAPFKLAQRYIAFAFTGVFIFIMLNGVLGLIYGVVDIQAVKQARDFANEMYLGEIMLTIVVFYFGAGTIESMNRKQKGKQNEK